MEEEERERKRREESQDGAGGPEMSTEGMRWQMQIQEDVSRQRLVGLYSLDKKEHVLRILAGAYSLTNYTWSENQRGNHTGTGRRN